MSDLTAYETQTGSVSFSSFGSKEVNRRLIGLRLPYDLEKDAIAASIGAIVVRLNREAEYLKEAWEKLFDRIPLVSYHRQAISAWLMGYIVDLTPEAKPNKELDNYFDLILADLAEPKQEFDFKLDLILEIEQLLQSIFGDLKRDSEDLTADLMQKNPELANKPEEVKRAVEKTVASYLPEPVPEDKVLTKEEIEEQKQKKVPKTKEEFHKHFGHQINKNIARELQVKPARPYVYNREIAYSIFGNINNFWAAHVRSQMLIVETQIFAGRISRLSITQTTIDSYSFEAQRASGLTLNPFNMQPTITVR